MLNYFMKKIKFVSYFFILGFCFTGVSFAMGEAQDKEKSENVATTTDAENLDTQEDESLGALTENPEVEKTEAEKKAEELINKEKSKKLLQKINKEKEEEEKERLQQSVNEGLKSGTIR